MAAQKYDIPCLRSCPTVKEYRYRWTLTAGSWIKVPYQYREVSQLEYRQPCDRDYPKEIIGAPGDGYEVVTYDKIIPTQGYAELVTIWRSLITMTWTDI